MSCFMGQNPTVPVYRGEIQTRNLGMAVEAWSLDGKSVCIERVNGLEMENYCFLFLFSKSLAVKGFMVQSTLTTGSRDHVEVAGLSPRRDSKNINEEN